MATIEQLRARLNPANQNHAALIKALGGLQVMKGEDGYTPKKGVDYFTPAEVQELLQIIDTKIKSFERGLKGDKGEKGERGERGESGKDGVDGYTPVAGLDYFTKKDREELLRQIVAGIPKAKDGISPKIKDIAKETIALINNNPDQQFVTVKQLTDFLKRGGFRGGAGSGTSTTQTVYSDTVSGTIDGVNTVFTVATNINTAFTLYLANSVYQPGIDFTTSGTTITMVVAPDASLSGQPFWLLHN